MQGTRTGKTSKGGIQGEGQDPRDQGLDEHGYGRRWNSLMGVQWVKKFHFVFYGF